MGPCPSPCGLPHTENGGSHCKNPLFIVLDDKKKIRDLGGIKVCTTPRSLLLVYRQPPLSVCSRDPLWANSVESLFLSHEGHPEESMTSSSPYYLPKAPSPNTIISRLKNLTETFEGDKNSLVFSFACFQVWDPFSNSPNI